MYLHIIHTVLFKIEFKSRKKKGGHFPLYLAMHFFSSKPGSAYCLNALKVKVFFESSAAGIRTTTVVVRTTTRMWPESLNDFNFFFCSATVRILCLLSSTFFENRFRLVVACKFSWIFHFQGNGGGGLHPLK